MPRIAIPESLQFSSPNRSSRDTDIVDCIVLHHTGSSSFSGATSWLCNPRSGVSAHYVIGRSVGQIAKLVPLSHAAWHAGTAQMPSWCGVPNRGKLNKRSVGIELVNDGSGTQVYTDIQVLNTAALVIDIKEAMPQIRFLLTHAQIALPPGRKNDPIGFPMSEFSRLVGLLWKEGR